MLRTVALAVLVAGLAVAGTFAQAPLRQPPTTRPNGSERILIAEAIPDPQQPAAPAAPAPVPTQPAGPVHVIIFVDITPNNKDAGTALCKQFIADTRKDPGVTRADLLVQTNRSNHLVLEIVFANQAAYERHSAAQHTKDFHGKVFPIIGSPFDERPHYALQ